MSIYSFHNSSLSKIEMTTFKSEGILERQNLQAAVRAQIDVIAPNCLVIAEEFSEWDESLRRIDLLAVDKKGNLVVIELKRTETGEHMELQALRYAAMVSTLTWDRTVEIFQDYLKSIGSDKNAKETLVEFLGWDDVQEEDFAMDVRIVLVSAGFSKELTTTVLWLNERDVDVRCVKLIPYKYQADILLDVQQIIPLPEAENYQINIRKQSEQRREARASRKDYTHYGFNGYEYNKRNLVFAVVRKWFADHTPQTVNELECQFQIEGLFTPVEQAREIYERQKIARHFLEEDDLLKFPNSTTYAISNQWGKSNILKFVNRARSLGYEILEMSDE